VAAEPGVLCLGNIVFDILVRPADRLEWNTTHWVESIAEQLGGNGANTAYALAVLGAPVRLVSSVGRDAAGDFVLARLREAGVDLNAVTRSDAPTATTVGLVNSSGDRLFLHRPGVSAEAFAGPVEFSPALVAGMGHFHLGNPFALPAVRPHAAETLRRARAAGLTTSVDTGWDSAGRWLADLAPALPYIDLLFANADEERRLGGARELRRMGTGAVVVKRGAEGCAVFSAEAEFTSPAVPAPVVDTTGAGDCFAGAWLAARARGLGLQECARFANATAALSIQHLGATAWGEAVRDARQAALRTTPAASTGTPAGSPPGSPPPKP
jgi:sugar/nucleoside kinase (ribokinase family)